MNAVILFIIILFGLLLLCLFAKISYSSLEGYTNKNTLWADICKKEQEDGVPNGTYGCYGKPGNTGHTGHTGENHYFTKDVDTPVSAKVLDNDEYSLTGVSEDDDDDSVISQNLYMLKSACIPPICPTCPDMKYPDRNVTQGADGGKNDREKNGGEKNGYGEKKEKDIYESSAPYPILPDFTSFGI